ncbi:hypothetical protein BKA65DRAFT_558803 [Rhexocercosporidium sp. MPI-PUGE-AT-0058]|nr:hypothetical protein BKA65DRAFT_558803 [Rhexocercosporidium sp. MPI-PUGE-AT-0058]
MGFIVIVDHDKEQISVTLDGKVVSLFPRTGIAEGLEAQRVWAGGDTVGAYAQRLIVHEDIHATVVKDETSAAPAHNEDRGTTTSRNRKGGKKGAKIRRNRNSSNKAEATKKMGGDAAKSVADSDDKRSATSEDKFSKTVDPMKHAIVNVCWQAYHNTNVEVLQEKFDTCKFIFKTSHPDFETWKTRSMAFKLNGVPITNVVALGLGSHHPADNGVPKDRADVIMPIHTGFQLVIVKMIREILGEENQPLPCVIQDICYSGLDKEFLTTLDFTVVDDPDAFGFINTNTLVFHIGTYLRIAWWICAGTWPAAMITENFWANPTGSLVHEPPPSYVFPGLKEMFTHYETDKEFIEKRPRNASILNIYTLKDMQGSDADTKDKLAQGCSDLEV